jgi:hypothetical protein
MLGDEVVSDNERASLDSTQLNSRAGTMEGRLMEIVTAVSDNDEE